MGKLKAIWIKRAKLGPMDPVEEAQLVAGKGLVGNANQGGKRQITVISTRGWRDAENDLGETLDPRLRRANLYVKGIDLQDTGGQTMKIGDCRIAIHGETRPCERMEAGFPGLQEALEPDWRGGVYGEVLEGGDIAVGDKIEFEEHEHE